MKQYILDVDYGTCRFQSQWGEAGQSATFSNPEATRSFQSVRVPNFQPQRGEASQPRSESIIAQAMIDKGLGKRIPLPKSKELCDPVVTTVR
jgi:hypothetical protein